MRIVTDGRAAMEKAVLALGMFDGVHIGHQVLLKRAKVLAGRNHAPLVVCTFTGHPLEQIAPERCPPALTTFQERAELLQLAGVELLFSQPFTDEMRQMPPEVYVGELVRRFHPTDVVCGYNHTFGKGGSGTPAFLAALGDALGFRTEVVPQVTLNGEEVSSSTIRSAIGRGDLATANRLLGRPYSITGNMQPDGSGKYSFQNEASPKQALPQGGYRCIVECREPSRRLPATAVISAANEWVLALPAALPEQNVQLLMLTKD